MQISLSIIYLWTKHFFWHFCSLPSSFSSTTPTLMCHLSSRSGNASSRSPSPRNQMSSIAGTFFTWTWQGLQSTMMTHQTPIKWESISLLSTLRKNSRKDSWKLESRIKVKAQLEKGMKWKLCRLTGRNRGRSVLFETKGQQDQLPSLQHWV